MSQRPLHATPPKKMGRPSKYTPELAAEICKRLSSGQSLREIGRDPAMPEPITIRMWVIEGKHPDFSVQYAKAREAQADHYFDEMFEISDEGSNDWLKRNRRGVGTWEENHEVVNRSRLRVDTRKWALARMSPKKYGDRSEVEHSGNGSSTTNVLIVNIEGQREQLAGNLISLISRRGSESTDGP